MYIEFLIGKWSAISKVSCGETKEIPDHLYSLIIGKYLLIICDYFPLPCIKFLDPLYNPLADKPNISPIMIPCLISVEI